MSIFDRFNKTMDAAALAASQQEINQNSNSGDYEEVPVGKYEVKLEKLECKLSKTSKRPMVSAWFRIVEGKWEKNIIFYNAVFYEDWMRHRVVKFLSDLLDDHDHEAQLNLLLKTGSVDDINDFLLDMHEELDGQVEYLLNYGENKGYKTYTVEDVFDVA